MTFRRTVKRLGRRHWLLFSCQVVSNSFQPSELQHASLPCSSPSSTVCSNSCPLSQWCHPTISSSHRLLPLPSFLPSIRVFSSESAQVASSSQSTGASASASVLLMNIQDWFPLGLTHLSSLKSKELLRVFSSTTIWKHQFFGAQPSLWSSSHIYITTALEWTELNSSAPRTKGVPILCGLFFLKSFYWSTVDLQYCVSFHFTASWFSHIYIYIYTYIYPLFFLGFPIDVIAKYWIEFPCYTVGSYQLSGLCIAVCIWQFHPPNYPLPPTEYSWHSLDFAFILFYFPK